MRYAIFIDASGSCRGFSKEFSEAYGGLKEWLRERGIVPDVLFFSDGQVQHYWCVSKYFVKLKMEKAAGATFPEMYTRKEEEYDVVFLITDDHHLNRLGEDRFLLITTPTLDKVLGPPRGVYPRITISPINRWTWLHFRYQLWCQWQYFKHTR